MTITDVPLLDLTRLDPALVAELEETFSRVLRSGRFIMGPEVTALEEECAEYCGTKHAIGVSSGTDALVIALMALGIGPGDEVLCPSYTFFATAGSVWRIGATPVFVDSLPSSFNIDPEDIEWRITPNTKAIIPVHLYGQCADMKPILALAEKHGFKVIEDAAQAIGSEYEGQRAGSMGTIGCFSFFPSKNLGALGDGGIVTTNDDDLAETLRVLRVHGGKPKYHHAVVGGNFRIDALQAALVRVKLRHLDESTAKRQSNADLYTSLLTSDSVGVVCPTDAEIAAGTAEIPGQSRLTLPAKCQSRHIYNQYVVRVHGLGRRDELRTFLTERRVGTEIYYPVPLHLQGCFASLGGAAGDLTVAEKAAKETIALPIFSELTEDEIMYVCEQIREFCAED
jgi:dTDP-4-amino-4,6-dideoxygalactose transaminase